MAWTFEGDLGSGSEKTSDNSFLITALEDCPVGNLAIVVAVTDNIATSTGASNDHAITDESSNTWTKIEWTETEGAANDGTCISFSYTTVTTQIDTGDDMIVTTTANVAAKVLGAMHFSFTEASIVAAASNALGDIATEIVSIDISGLSSAETLLVWMIGLEADASTVAIDADYTAVHSAIRTTGGANPSNQTLYDAYRILTGTGDTVDTDTNVVRDTAQILVAFREVSAPGGTEDPYPYVIGGYYPTQG